MKRWRGRGVEGWRCQEETRDETTKYENKVTSPKIHITVGCMQREKGQQGDLCNSTPPLTKLRKHCSILCLLMETLSPSLRGAARASRGRSITLLITADFRPFTLPRGLINCTRPLKWVETFRELWGRDCWWFPTSADRFSNTKRTPRDCATSWNLCAPSLKNSRALMSSLLICNRPEEILSKSKNWLTMLRASSQALRMSISSWHCSWSSAVFMARLRPK